MPGSCEASDYNPRGGTTILGASQPIIAAASTTRPTLESLPQDEKYCWAADPTQHGGKQYPPCPDDFCRCTGKLRHRMDIWPTKPPRLVRPPTDLPPEARPRPKAPVRPKRSRAKSPVGRKGSRTKSPAVRKRSRRTK